MFGKEIIRIFVMSVNFRLDDSIILSLKKSLLDLLEL